MLKDPPLESVLPPVSVDVEGSFPVFLFSEEKSLRFGTGPRPLRPVRDSENLCVFEGPVLRELPPPVVKAEG